MPSSTVLPRAPSPSDPRLQAFHQLVNRIEAHPPLAPDKSAQCPLIDAGPHADRIPRQLAVADRLPQLIRKGLRHRGILPGALASYQVVIIKYISAVIGMNALA